VAKRYARDEQTGKIFLLVPEGSWDIVAAVVSILYLIAGLVFFSWLFIDTFIGRNVLLKAILPEGSAYLTNPLFRLIAYTVIGGGLGGVINGIRSFIVWHPERRAFGWRFMWKYVTLPLVGCVLAAIVYAIVRSGIAAFGGDFAPNEDLTTQAMSAFAVGALSGYGSHKVFRWLDNQVNKLFKVPLAHEVKVPDLKDKTQAEAEAILTKANLTLGKVNEEVSEDPDKVGKVIQQDPPADAKVPAGSSVDIVIGKAE
jgi:hypothetical protein